MSAYATQLSELSHANLLEEALRQRDLREAAEKREEALREALDEINDPLKNGYEKGLIAQATLAQQPVN